MKKIEGEEITSEELKEFIEEMPEGVIVTINLNEGMLQNAKKGKGNSDC